MTPLGPPGGPPVDSVTVDLSGSGLRILAPRPFPAGSLVKMESPTRMLLGEVLRSDPAENGYHVAVMVQEVLLFSGLSNEFRRGQSVPTGSLKQRDAIMKR